MFPEVSLEMKVAFRFLAVVACTAALPLELPSGTPDEIEWSKLVPSNLYVEIINSTASALPLGFRVIGGKEVTPHSVPYQAALIINTNSLCGGSLISTNHVLTAAHCTVSASFVQVRLGAHYFNREEDTQIRVTSTSIKNHASYNPLLVANDIAVIFLPWHVALNEHVQAVPLAPADSGAFVGSSGRLAGWGRTSDSSSSPSPVLNAVNVSVIANGVCRNIFGSLIVESILCSSGTGIVGACNGDSGGALVVDGAQIAIASFGATTCEGGTPTGYMRISSFRTWIYEYTGV